MHPLDASEARIAEALAKQVAEAKNVSTSAQFNDKAHPNLNWDLKGQISKDQKCLYPKRFKALRQLNDEMISTVPSGRGARPGRKDQ